VEVVVTDVGYQADAAPRGKGRPPSTSHAMLEEIGIRLFTERGYDETSIDDIAAAAGIGRRTFFHYFPSKADLVWGDFEGELDRMRGCLAALDPGLPMMEAVRQAVIDFNRLRPEQEAQHRRRLRLILGVPTLIANSTLQFAHWRAVIAEFAAQRLGQDPEDLLPRTIGHCALGASISAYEEWLRDADGTGADLSALLADAFGELAHGFAGESR
jgi:TetR/AcrR family transcriptional regulator, regulator of mycofactocin system